jgi:hypothetical protein
MSTTSNYKKRKSNEVKIYMFKGSNYKKGDLNLADDRSFLIGGRWARFLLNFSDSHLSHLDLGRGAAMSEDRFRLGVNFVVPGWIRMILFDVGGAFFPKRTKGATGENWKVEPSSFLGSEPSSCCRESKWVQEKN